MKRKRNDYSRMLLMAALLVGVVRYAAAFAASDQGVITGGWSEFLTGAIAFTGAGMGVLDVIGSAYLFDGWRRAMPRSGQAPTLRFLVLTVFVMGLLGGGLIVLVPFTVSRIMHGDMAGVLGPEAVWYWSIAVNVLPYFLVGGLTTGTKGIVSASEETGAENSAAKIGNFPGQESATLGKTRWERLSPEERAELPQLTDSQIIASYGGSVRRARMWRQWAREEDVSGQPEQRSMS